ncbi:MAG: amidohydrolase family protein [Acidothermaceae bacterium]
MTTPIVDGHVVVSHDETADDVLHAMDVTGVDIALVSPADDEVAARNREGNDRVLALCAHSPERLFPYAVASPWFGASAVHELDRALSAGARAVKINSALQGFLLLDTIVDPLIEVARAHGVLVYAHTGTPVHALPLQLAELACRFPDVTFIMGRSGRTDFRGDAPTALAIAPNILADTSHDYGVTGLTNMFRAIGAQRMVFCSDQPYATAAEGLRAVRAVEMSDAERGRLLGGNLLAHLVPEFSERT